MNKKILSLAILFLTGCQTSDNTVDPYEDYNRQVFAFNEQADLYVINPTIQAYRTVIPAPFRMGINNFYSNIAEISYAVNFGLQGQWQDCYHSGLRLTVNSLFGVGGLFDMAHDLGLPKKRNDFGKTLYTMGYIESPYSVSPFFGPSTMRDMIGFSVDRMLLNPLLYLNSPALKTDLFILNYIETRSNVNEYTTNFTETPFVEDKYTFMRDAYLQYRKYQLENGIMDWDSFYEDAPEDANPASVEELTETSPETPSVS